MSCAPVHRSGCGCRGCIFVSRTTPFDAVRRTAAFLRAQRPRSHWCNLATRSTIVEVADRPMMEAAISTSTLVLEAWNLTTANEHIVKIVPRGRCAPTIRLTRCSQRAATTVFDLYTSPRVRRWWKVELSSQWSGGFPSIGLLLRWPGPSRVWPESGRSV